MKNELVSIVMPTYNSEKFVLHSIQSVLQQTYDNWELIVVDDGSTDNTGNLVLSLQDSRIKLIQLDLNQGPSKARNVGIEAAKGRYIAFLDSDDLWMPTKLEKQVNFLMTNDLAFTYSSYFLIDERNRILGKFVTKSQVTYFDLLKTNCIGCSTVIYDTAKIGKIFMPNIFHEDYATWLLILRKIGYSKGILEPLSAYRLRRTSLSSSKLKALKAQWRIYRDVEKIDLICSCYFFTWYVFNGLKKYGLVRFINSR